MNEQLVHNYLREMARRGDQHAERLMQSVIDDDRSGVNTTVYHHVDLCRENKTDVHETIPLVSKKHYDQLINIMTTLDVSQFKSQAEYAEVVEEIGREKWQNIMDEEYFQYE